MKTVLLIIVMLIVSCQPREIDEARIETEIREAMAIQVESWNRDDLDGFLEYYWDSEKLTFHSGKKILVGRDTLEAMYRETYSGEQRGVLSFLETDIEVLSESSACVIGRWKVELPDTVKQGRFTLIFRRLGKGWRIVHDHSS